MLKALREQCAAPRAAADCGILGGLSAQVASATPPAADGAPPKRRAPAHVHGSHGRNPGAPGH